MTRLIRSFMESCHYHTQILPDAAYTIVSRLLGVIAVASTAIAIASAIERPLLVRIHHDMDLLHHSQLTAYYDHLDR